MSSKKGSSGMSYFSEDSAGFRIQPKTVLIMSLVFIGIVVLLHIYSKLGSASVKEEMPKAPNT
jgi:protein transport protein SEC61 subunit beta